MPKPGAARWRTSKITGSNPCPTQRRAASPPVLAINGARATIRLNRPKHLNRLQAEDLDALLRLFDRVEADPAIRVLVLTGTGRAFSAGYDLELGRRARRERRRTTERRLGVRGRRQPAGGSGRADDLPAQWRRLWRLDRSGAGLRFPHRRRHLRDVHAGGAARAALLQERHRAATCRRLGVDNAKMLFLTAQKIDAAGDAADRLSHRDGARGGARRGGRRAGDAFWPATRRRRWPA